MSKTVVRCRCGHQIVAKEVLRTDLYERSSGRDCVYIKYRCSRCKRMGQAFIAENRWDWSILDAGRSEMSTSERDRFLDETPISAVELLNFHSQLQTISSLGDLQTLRPAAEMPEKADNVRDKDIRERDAKDVGKDLRLRSPNERNNSERNNTERNNAERNAGERPTDGDALGRNGNPERSDDTSNKS
jgi:DNA-directed RNA polymerase subunit RPC12/RpoP